MSNGTQQATGADGGDKTGTGAGNTTPATTTTNTSGGGTTAPVIGDDKLASTLADKLDAKELKYIEKINAENADRRKVNEDLKAKVAQLETEKNQREQDKLKEEGKYKEALEATTPKLEKAKEKLMDSKLQQLAQAAGIVDLDAVALIDKSKIKVTDDYEVVGAEEAMKAFKEAKPKFFEQPATAPTTTGAAVPTPPSASSTGGGSKTAPGLVHAPGTPEYNKVKENFLRTGKA